MNLIKLNSVLSLGEVVAIRNVRGQVWVTLDYYGKRNDYTTVEIENMIAN